MESLASKLFRKLGVKFILSKIGAGLSGPGAFLASMFMDRFLIWLEKSIVNLVQWINDNIKNKSERQIDEKNNEKYKESLQDGQSETDLNNSTSDLLNGRGK
jgi:hypothetical protein